MSCAEGSMGFAAEQLTLMERLHSGCLWLAASLHQLDQSSWRYKLPVGTM